MSHEAASGTGIGTLGLLGIAFVTLKLLGRLDWEWVWVLCPFWGPFALAIAGLFLFGIGCLFLISLALAIDGWGKR